MSPDHPNIIDKAKIAERFIGSFGKKFLFQVVHKDVGIFLRHFSSHSCVLFLHIIYTVKNEIVVF